MAELRAGRELDALVEEKIFGRKIIAVDWPCGYDPECGCYEAALSLAPEDTEHGWFTERGPVFQCWPDDPKNHRIVEPVPFRSTDIAAAWQVVEKMLATPLDDGDHPLAVVVRIEATGIGESRAVCIIETGVVNEDIEAYGDTAPEAISLAALKAKGV